MNGGQSLSVPGLLVDAAKIHWANILTFAATAAVYAGGLLIVAGTIVSTEPGSEVAENVTLSADPMSLFVGLILILLLSAGAFVLWLRIGALGLNAALQVPPGGWFRPILRTAGLLIAAGLMGFVPVALVAGLVLGATQTMSVGAIAFIVLLLTAAINVAVAMLFVPLVETSLGSGCFGSPQVRAMASALRPILIGTLLAATFGLTFIGMFLLQLFAAVEAAISMQLVQSLISALSVTFIATILGIAYRRLREIASPPADLQR